MRNINKAKLDVLLKECEARAELTVKIAQAIAHNTSAKLVREEIKTALAESRKANLSGNEFERINSLLKVIVGKNDKVARTAFLEILKTVTPIL